MATPTLSHSLTTLDRVKIRLGISTSNTNFDDMLGTAVNAATDLIEGMTERRFKEQSITDEKYSIPAWSPNMLVLKQAPVSSIDAFKFRDSSFSSPTFTDFEDANYILKDNGDSGIVYLAGGLPSGINTVKVDYTAGYKIDFSNADDTSKHELPHEISDLAERVAARIFKRKEREHLTSETFEGMSTTYRDLLDGFDRDVVSRYKRTRLL